LDQRQKCPCCGRDLQLGDINLVRPFLCPHCQRELEVSRFYSTFFGLLSLALSFAISFGIGLRDIGLIAAGFVGWFPAVCIVAFIMNRLFPPKPVPVVESITR
jgi:hypothetical protein